MHENALFLLRKSPSVGDLLACLRQMGSLPSPTPLPPPMINPGYATALDACITRNYCKRSMKSYFVFASLLLMLPSCASLVDQKIFSRKHWNALQSWSIALKLIEQFGMIKTVFWLQSWLSYSVEMWFSAVFYLGYKWFEVVLL